METQDASDFCLNLDINALPLETLVDILRRIDGCTLARCREVCKKWKEIIDGTDLLWQENCEKEFKYSSKIAKRKAGSECQWYHIYRNLKMWSHVASVEKNLRNFERFTADDNRHVFDYDVLPLREANGYILYSTSTLKYIPVLIPDSKCYKISSNDDITVILTKSGLHLERTVSKPGFITASFFKAEAFVLTKDKLYFFSNRDVYKCNLLSDSLSAEHLLHCDNDLKEIQVDNCNIYLFTVCGKIVTISNLNKVSEKAINIPREWMKQIKHICALDDKNFVCYSRNIFKIETDKYKHLYLDFPMITALFFYGDVVIIGTRAGDILLYRLSSQKTALRPIFENLGVLPDGKYAVDLDVRERRTGPVIVVATCIDVMLLEMKFFSNEQEPERSFPAPANKLNMYKRLLRLRDRLQSGACLNPQ